MCIFLCLSLRLFSISTCSNEGTSSVNQGLKVGIEAIPQLIFRWFITYTYYLYRIR